MIYTIRLIVALTSLMLVGCASSRLIVGETTSPPTVAEGERAFAALAGEWEYEEGSAVIELVLDEQGTGNYPFKGGRLETTSLVGHEWRGRWMQPGNDREGGFVVQLTADMAEGAGRWWYTRIGPVSNPPEKGGRFHLTRIVPDPHMPSTTSASLP